MRGRKVYLENVSTLSEKDTRYFFNIRKMKREAQICNNFVTEIRITIMIIVIIILFTLDEIVRVMVLSKTDALIKEMY